MSEDGQIKIEFKANPVQRKFILSRAKADFFSARMGEGKSAALCWACFYHTKYNPGARWLFIRDTWENLRDTTMKEFHDWFAPLGEWRAVERKFIWKCGEMRGEVQFRGLDEEKDASKLQSRDLGGFAMDEPAPAADTGGISKLIFTTAMTRLRQKGMKWYAAKLAANNPDETHWTYSTFVDPGSEQYRCHQTKDPENLDNLPEDYYDTLRDAYADRLDLIDRFVHGTYGFQRRGRPVTPAWNDNIHLAEDLEPSPRLTLHLLHDFGLTPCVTFTQITPEGRWLFLDCLQGEDVGTIEHIEQAVAPMLRDRYRGFSIDHTIDPAGQYRDQTSSQSSPERAIRELLGGPVIAGEEKPGPAIDALNAVLSRVMNDGRGVVQVDRERAKEIWHALRGGWHYPQRPSGVIGDKPVKNMSSHPGDTARYGAARFFPIGRIRERKVHARPNTGPKYFGRPRGALGFERPGLQVPAEAREIGGEK